MTQRTPISAGNWKMYGTNAEADALCDGLAPLAELGGVTVVLAASFLQLARVRERFQGTGVGVAGQNMHGEEKGAFTGEVSPLQLREVADWVLLGHSERRQYFCENNEALNGKVRAALSHGLRPILCVGERGEERERGESEAVLNRQVRVALRGVDIPDGFVIAYEPVWAIGTGTPATPDVAQDTIASIRAIVADVTGAATAETVRILYGGSVKPENIAAFAAQPDIDGALVGGAALDAEAFLAITQAIAAASSG